MSVTSCMARVMAVMLLTSTAVPNSAAVAQPLNTLVANLEEWLDRNADLPRRDIPPRISFSDMADHGEHTGPVMAIGARTRGLYDPQSGTITLIEPWSQFDTVDVSVLLHELVHHRQPGVHGHCPSSSEPQAYRLQARWLAEQSTKLDVDWLAIALNSGCALHDVHP